MRVATTAVAVVLSMAAVASMTSGTPAAPDDGEPLSISVRLHRDMVRPGGLLRGRLSWNAPPPSEPGFEFLARWQLRTAGGSIAGEGAREVRARADRGNRHSTRFRLRVPADIDPGGAATFEVVVASFRDHAVATRPVLLRRARLRPVAGQASLSLEGRLESSPDGSFLLRTADEPDRPWTLTGSGVSALHERPDIDGASVRIEGREVRATRATPAVPEERFLAVTGVQWLDPPPLRIDVSFQRRGSFRPPEPPAAIGGDYEAWLAWVETTRRSWSLRSNQDVQDLVAAPGSVARADAFATVDWSKEQAVYVTTGCDSNPSFTCSIRDAWYEPRTGRTTVRYDIVRFRGLYAAIPAQEVSTLVFPLLPGPVVFERREWVGD